MTEIQLKIIYNAIKIRVIRDGENLDEVLNSYNKLSEGEKERLRNKFLEEYPEM